MTAGAVAVPTIVPLRAPVLGQHKAVVDSGTKIELHSDTEGAVIYFTVNGGRPEPFHSAGNIQAKSTFTYREPFCLPPGKRTIKALARTEDGRESHMVTKVFDVEPCETGDNGYEQSGLEFLYNIPAADQAKREVQKFAGDMVTSKEAWEDLRRLKSAEGRRRPPTGTRFLSGRLDTDRSLSSVVDQEIYNTRPGGVTLDNRNRWKLPPDDATQALRLQRETDFLKCIYCFAARPTDPFVRFCPECGNALPPLPQTRLPPPQPGQMGVCIHCKSMVPLNTPHCLVCEAPMEPQLIPQASVRLADKLLCTVCGTANQSDLRICVTCSASLAKTAKLIQHKPPSGMGGGDTMSYNGMGDVSMRDGAGRPLICSKCARVNNPDSRFCDWCGTKSAAISPTSLLTCPKCRSSNGPYALFCGNCGTTISPPNKMNGVSLSLPANITPKHDASCQTVGLFYPSQREIDHKHKSIEEKLSLEKEMKDRKPLLTAVSPGRGYWRKQMEHICGHLKAHASNNADFRALIGEPRMGRLLSAVVNEDGYELSLTVNFALRGNDDSNVGKTSYRDSSVNGRPPYSFTRARSGSIQSYGSMESLRSAGGRSSRNSARKNSARRPKSATSSRKKSTGVKKALDDDATPEDRKLMKELGKKGEGSPEVIQELIEEGASVNCVNKDGMPMLHLAALNRHIDAIPVLVQEGADINKKGPTNGNTALHEVVGLGPQALPAIDALLGCGASPSKKNDKGDTPFDIAVKLGYDSVAKKLAAHIGQATLGRMTRPKSPGVKEI